ncbi:MAG: response regulator transcription factor [Dehalococcoidia bacterium]
MLVHFPTLLIVDDDPTITRSLRVNLEADGFEILTAASGQEALDLMEQKIPDLVIVDLLLPDMHGFELCKKLKSYMDVPIIMLTGVGSESSITSGLDFYAEDYVVKPFSYRELLARIGRVLKRTQRLLPKEQVLVVDKGMSIDFARHLALLKKGEVGLTPVESRILSILAINANKVVRSERLIDEAWPDGEGDPNRLWVNIRRLRNKLEDDPSHPKRLITERGMGYRLQADE